MRGGAFTVMCMAIDPTLAVTHSAAMPTALAVGRRSCWLALFAAVALVNAGPSAVNAPLPVPVSGTDAVHAAT